MRAAAVLVVYTEAFLDMAVQRVVDLMRRLDRGGAVVVVSNNPRLRFKDDPRITVLQGNNLLHEFGAWQTGLDHLRQQPGAESLEAVVFANDTFCHYRNWGALEQAAFVRAGRTSMRRRTGEACGEPAPSYERLPYEFDGLRMQEWIATYLFTINRAALESLNWRVQPSMQEVERWAPCGADEESFFAQDMDPSLKLHFQGWLFGRKPRPGWRRCAPLSEANHAMMQGKAHALICEQLLTANLLRGGARIRSVFRHPVIFAALRVFGRM